MLRTQATPNFLDPALEWRRVFAEIWGTFLLVLVGIGGHMTAGLSGTAPSDIALALAPGITVMAIIYFMGTVSGAHLNPAVTLAFAIRRNFPWIRVPGYIAGQLAGAILAATTLATIFGSEPLRFGLTLPAQGFTPLQAFMVEAIATAGLVNTILGTAAGARNIGPNGAIAVGGYIAVSGIWAGPVSGAAMNPARSLAPALITGHTEGLWIYLAGPLTGALAGVMFEWLLKGQPTPEGAIAAQGTLGEEPAADEPEQCPQTPAISPESRRTGQKFTSP